VTGPRTRTFPAAGVVRVGYQPGELPRVSDAVGPNRFDDPRPNSRDRFLIRYAATTLRGCLLELLAAFRPNDEAAELEQRVTGSDQHADPDPDEQLRSALATYLTGRRLATLKAPRRTRFLSIDDAFLQAELDREPAVRALLDSPKVEQRWHHRAGVVAPAWTVPLSGCRRRSVGTCPNTVPWRSETEHQRPAASTTQAATTTPKTAGPSTTTSASPSSTTPAWNPETSLTDKLFKQSPSSGSTTPRPLAALT